MLISYKSNVKGINIKGLKETGNSPPAPKGGERIEVNLCLSSPLGARGLGLRLKQINMAFLTVQDYKESIKDNILTDIIEGDDTLRQSAELKAQELMESYLNMRYKVGEIFSRLGLERNPIIIQFMVDITIYYLHKRINPNQIPDLRVEEFDNAKQWLSKVSAGKLKPNLPELSNDEGNSGIIAYGSNTKVNHKW